MSDKERKHHTEKIKWFLSYLSDVPVLFTASTICAFYSEKIFVSSINLNLFNGFMSFSVMIIFRHANFTENLIAFSLCLIPLKITTTCQTGKKRSVQLQNRYDFSLTGLYRKTMTEMVNM